MFNSKIIYQVDAFTNKAFKGNPAGVMLLNAAVEEKWMQTIAAEMNLSETAFVVSKGEAFDIRFFTPTVEIPLCGHATLASAHILYELGIKKAHEPILFHTKGGDLEVFKKEEEIVMNFPSYTFEKTNLNVDFKTLVGFEPIETYASVNGWVIAVASTDQDIANANPNFEQLNSNGLGSLMITSTGESYGVDFVVRCFVPKAGINEDPVTGSAQCALVPIWKSRTGKDHFKALQLSKRTGNLNVSALNDRVEIRGNAITIFKADLMV